MLEAYYQTSSAAHVSHINTFLSSIHTDHAYQFAIACGLHQITLATLTDAQRSKKLHLTYTPWNSHVSRQNQGIAAGTLEPPQDGVELGERIYVWWCLYLLDKMGSTTLGLPSAIPDETSPTDSPSTSWPRLLDEYARVSPWCVCVDARRLLLTSTPP